MTSPVIILGCGAQKRELANGEEVEIIDLYTGPLYRSRLAYARALGGPHWILSGWHGLRRTDHLVGSYEHDLGREPKRERDAWADRVAGDVQHHLDPARPIVVLASGPYVRWIQSLVSSRRSWGRDPYTITVPCEGLGIGEQRAWLARETARIAAEVEREQCAPLTPASITGIASAAVESHVERDDEPAEREPSYADDAAEVLRDLPTWSDDEDVMMRVGALKVLLAGGRKAAA